jgi:hypothetical protein
VRIGQNKVCDRRQLSTGKREACRFPLFPAGATHLNEHLALECHEGQVTDFNGHLTVFTRPQADLAAFGLWTGQVDVNGSSSQGDSRRAFGVRKRGVRGVVPVPKR